MDVMPQVPRISVWGYAHLSFIAGLGALYGPLILHTLPPSVHHTVIKAFKAIMD
jgi:hypothetical protein